MKIDSSDNDGETRATFDVILLQTDSAVVVHCKDYEKSIYSTCFVSDVYSCEWCVLCHNSSENRTDVSFKVKKAKRWSFVNSKDYHDF